MALNSAMARRPKLEFLQILRLLAAAMVLFDHARQVGPESSPFFEKAQLGILGVLLFFVISGYVIALQAGSAPGAFIVHRWLRIYPPYIAASIIGGVGLQLCGYFSPDNIKLSWSLLLLPKGDLVGWTQVPYWTLIYEVVFYTLTFISLLVGGRRGFDALLVVWAFVISFYPFDGPPLQADLAIVRAPLCLFFIGGAVLSRLHQGISWLMYVVLLIVCGPLYWRDLPSSRIVLFGMGLVIVVHLAIALGDIMRAPRALVAGGDWSYGLYLLHVPVLWMIYTVTPIARLSFWPAFALLTMGAAAIGLSFGYAEYSFYKWAKARVDRGRARSAADDKAPSQTG
jgi:peptidoglycan/LPS O-acetylase OafA/YrhL